MLLAHLSDPHLTTGPLAGGPAAGLHAALGRLLRLPTRPDAAVITGDLTDHGHPDEYHQLTELLTEIPLPVYLAAGNHHNRGALLDAFAGTAQLAGGDQAHYAADLPGATLVVLDGPSPSPATLGDTGAAARRRPLRHQTDRQTRRPPRVLAGGVAQPVVRSLTPCRNSRSDAPSGSRPAPTNRGRNRPTRPSGTRCACS